MDVAKGGVTRFEKLPEVSETLKDGNFAHRSFSTDSSRGVGVEVSHRMAHEWEHGSLHEWGREWEGGELVCVTRVRGGGGAGE